MVNGFHYFLGNRIIGYIMCILYIKNRSISLWFSIAVGYCASSCLASCIYCAIAFAGICGC